MAAVTDDAPQGLPPLESLLRRSEKRTASVFLGTDLGRKDEEKRQGTSTCLGLRSPNLLFISTITQCTIKTFREN